jgi:DNA mismatch repair protein MutL
VRFREPSRLYRLVLSALRAKFLTGDMGTRLVPPAVDAAPVQERLPWTMPAWEASADETSGGGVAAPSAARAWSPAAGGTPVPPGTPAWEAAVIAPAPDGERAVQMHDRYIVVESRAGIEVIDQHALHERLLYERFKAGVAAGGLEVQRLLVPEKVELSPGELELVTAHADTLGRAGMQVEPFGGGTVIVTSKPALAGGASAGTLVREVLDRLAAVSAGGRGTGMLVDEVLHGMACKAAIKAGDPLSQAEVDALVRDRRLVAESHHCPHGRPTSLTLSRQDLDRQFRRT